MLDFTYFCTKHPIFEPIAKKTPFFSFKRSRLNEIVLPNAITQAYPWDREKNFSRSDVEETFQLLSQRPDKWVYQFVVQNGKLISPTFQESLFSPRVFKLAAFLRKLLVYFRIPDLKFLLCLEDYLGNKEVLQSIKIPFFLLAKLNHQPQGCLFPHTEWLAYWDLIRHQLKKKALTLPWNQRKKQLFWRGATSGLGYRDGLNSRWTVVQLGQQYPDEVDAYFSNLVQEHNLTNMVTSFLRSSLSPWKQVMHRYLLALDGNSFPGSFQWQLGSGSLVFKHDSPYQEWYYPALKPFIHYIPFAADASDLLEKKRWADDHEQECQQIIQSAEHFSDVYLTSEGIARYVLFILEQYAELYQSR